MKTVRDSYIVNCPSEAFSDEQQRLDNAINQAREAARLYVIPCSWEAAAIDDETVRVFRYRAAKEPDPRQQVKRLLAQVEKVADEFRGYAEKAAQEMRFADLDDSTYQATAGAFKGWNKRASDLYRAAAILESLYQTWEG